MITRAIITKVDLDRAKIQVRIPIFYSSAGDSPYTNFEISWASILCTPGINVNYKEGDIVVIGFEDNDAGAPIVLGHLMLRDHLEAASEVYGNFQQLQVQEQLIAPINSQIGETTYQQIFNAAECLSSILINLTADTSSVKQSFVLGDTFTSDNLRVLAHYAGGREELVTDYQIIQPDMATLGKKVVLVIYQGSICSYSIEIVSLKPINLMLSGTYQTEYEAGQVFNTSGLVATVLYNNNQTKNVTSEIQISNTKPLAASDTQIEVFYTEAGTTVSQAVPIVVKEASNT